MEKMSCIRAAVMSALCLGVRFWKQADKLSPACLLGGGNGHRAFFSIVFFFPEKLEKLSSSKALKLLIELPFPIHSQGAPSPRKKWDDTIKNPTVDPLLVKHQLQLI